MSRENLGNLIETQKGYAFKSLDYLLQGTGIIRVSDFTEDSICVDNVVYIDPELAKKYQQFKLSKNDVIIQTVGSWPTNPQSVVGKVIRVPEAANNFLLNQNAVKLMPNKKITLRYLYYLLKNCDFASFIISCARGAASQASITLDDIKSYEFDLPKIEVQNKIANVLTNYDDLIENNNKRIRILEEMAQKIYKEWFVDFKFPGHETTTFKDSNLGKIPQDWSVENMEKLLLHQIGGGWGSDEPSGKHNNEAFVIRGADIPSAKIGDVSKCPLRYHTESNLSSRIMQANDIVFEVSGGSKGQPVGRALLLNENLFNRFDNNVICASFCKLLRVDLSKILPEYVYLHLENIYKNGEIEKYQTQSTGIINFKFTFFLENEKMAIPAQNIQKKFKDIIVPIFDEVYLLGFKNQSLKQTRDLLLPKLISGEIDVENLEIA